MGEVSSAQARDRLAYGELLRSAGRHVVTGSLTLALATAPLTYPAAVGKVEEPSGVDAVKQERALSQAAPVSSPEADAQDRAASGNESTGSVAPGSGTPGMAAANDGAAINAVGDASLCDGTVDGAASGDGGEADEAGGAGGENQGGGATGDSPGDSSGDAGDGPEELPELALPELSFGVEQELVEGSVTYAERTAIIRIADPARYDFDTLEVEALRLDARGVEQQDVWTWHPETSSYDDGLELMLPPEQEAIDGASAPSDEPDAVEAGSSSDTDVPAEESADSPGSQSPAQVQEGADTAGRSNDVGGQEGSDTASESNDASDVGGMEGGAVAVKPDGASGREGGGSTTEEPNDTGGKEGTDTAGVSNDVGGQEGSDTASESNDASDVGGMEGDGSTTSEPTGAGGQEGSNTAIDPDGASGQGGDGTTTSNPDDTDGQEGGDAPGKTPDQPDPPNQTDPPASAQISLRLQTEGRYRSLSVRLTGREGAPDLEQTWSLEDEAFAIDRTPPQLSVTCDGKPLTCGTEAIHATGGDASIELAIVEPWSWDADALSVRVRHSPDDVETIAQLAWERDEEDPSVHRARLNLGEEGIYRIEIAGADAAGHALVDPDGAPFGEGSFVATLRIDRTPPEVVSAALEIALGSLMRAGASSAPDGTSSGIPSQGPSDAPDSSDASTGGATATGDMDAGGEGSPAVLIRRMLPDGSGELWLVRSSTALLRLLVDESGGLASAELAGTRVGRIEEAAVAEDAGAHAGAGRDAEAMGPRSLTIALSEESGGGFDRGSSVILRDLAGNERIWSLAPTGLARSWAGSFERANAPVRVVQDSMDGEPVESVSGHPAEIVLDATAPRVARRGTATARAYYGAADEAPTVIVEVEEQGLAYLARLDTDVVVATLYRRDNAAGALYHIERQIRVADLVAQGSSDGKTYALSCPCSAEGHYYVSDLQVSDLVGLKGSAAGITHDDAFTVDRTPPRVELSFDHGSPQLSAGVSYYAAPRTATLTVTEHNFDPRLVSVETNGQVGCWQDEGDRHTLEIAFLTDGDGYYLRVSGADLAGNAFTPCACEPFSIDTTPPQIRVEYLDAEGWLVSSGSSASAGDSAFAAASAHPGGSAQEGSSASSGSPASISGPASASGPMPTSGSGSVDGSLSASSSASASGLATVANPASAIDHASTSSPPSAIDPVSAGSPASASGPMPSSDSGLVDGSLFAGGPASANSFDPAAPIDGITYHDRPRRAVVTVREHSFDPAAFEIACSMTQCDRDLTAKPYDPRGWERVGRDEWRYVVDCSAEATYRLHVEGRDRAGNVALATDAQGATREGYVSPPFVVDLSAPELNCDFAPLDDCPELDGTPYSARPVELSVTLRDRHLDPATTTIVDAEGTELGFEDAAWALSGPDADGFYTYAKTIVYPEGARQTPALRVADRARNAATLAPHSFVVDLTAPSVTRAVVVGETGSRLSPSATVSAGGVDDPVYLFSQPAWLVVELEDAQLIDSVEVIDPDGFYALDPATSGVRRGSATARVALRLVDGALATGDSELERRAGHLVYLRARDIAGNVRIWSLERTGQVQDLSGSSALNTPLLGEPVFPVALVEDATAPILSLTGVEADRYYNEGQRLQLRLREHNFDYLLQADPSRPVLSLTRRPGADGGSPVSWSVPARQLVGSRPDYGCELNLEEDGHYEVSAALADAAGNPSNQASIAEFTIDKTAPTISVSFDNDEARNERYYAAPRVATITVTEHNFDPGLVQIDTSGAVGSWRTEGDAHRIDVSFGETPPGEEHTLAVSARDLAGNEAPELRVPSFVVDLSAPQVEIAGVGERLGTAPSLGSTLVDHSAYNGIVMPLISFRDSANLSEGECRYTLVGNKHGDVTERMAARRATAPNELHVTLRDLGYRADAADGFSAEREVFYVDDYDVDADDIYTLTAQASDLAGHVAEARMTFSVNRYGSNYLVDVLGVDAHERLGFEETGMLSASPTVLVREVNVSGAASEAAHHVQKEYANAVKAIGRVSAPDGAGYELRELGVDEAQHGWSEYVYVIHSENFGQGSDSDTGDGGQGVYRVNVMSDDAATNANTTASYWASDAARVEASPRMATEEFVLDQVGPVIDELDLPAPVAIGDAYEATVHVTDDITRGDTIEVLVDGEPVPVTPLDSSSFRAIEDSEPLLAAGEEPLHESALLQDGGAETMSELALMQAGSEDGKREGAGEHARANEGEESSLVQRRGEEGTGQTTQTSHAIKGTGSYRFTIPARAFLPRRVSIRVTDYAGRAVTLERGGFWATTLAIETLSLLSATSFAVAVVLVVRRKREGE